MLLYATEGTEQNRTEQNTYPQTPREGKGPLRTKTIFEKEEKDGELTLPDFRTCYKATVIQTVWYWPEDGHLDQWDETDTPETNPHVGINEALTRVPGRLRANRSLLSTRCRESQSPAPGNEGEPVLTPHTNVNSKRTKQHT